MITEERVWEELKKVLDPELGVSIVDMGLVYGVTVEDEKVMVKMTMTSPGCPMHQLMTRDAEHKISQLDGVEDVKVNLVWDPPWTPHRMSAELKKRFGIEEEEQKGE